MVTTSNKKLFNKFEVLRNHGMIRKKTTRKNYHWSYEVLSPGYNFRLSDINCALGFSQLKKLNQIIKKRNKIAKIYNKELNEYKNIINMPVIPKDQQSAWHLYIINIDFKKLKINKETLIKMLYEKKIITQVHYIPIYKHPFYKKLNKGKFINTENYFKSCLSLPIYFDLGTKEQSWVIYNIKKIISNSVKRYG